MGRLPSGQTRLGVRTPGDSLRTFVARRPKVGELSARRPPAFMTAVTTTMNGLPHTLRCSESSCDGIGLELRESNHVKWPKRAPATSQQLPDLVARITLQNTKSKKLPINLNHG